LIILAGRTLPDDSTLLSETVTGDDEFVVWFVAGLSKSVEFSMWGSTLSRGENPGVYLLD
jgi:hypothetical protein